MPELGLRGNFSHFLLPFFYGYAPYSSMDLYNDPIERSFLLKYLILSCLMASAFMRLSLIQILSAIDLLLRNTTVSFGDTGLRDKAIWKDKTQVNRFILSYYFEII